jgi:hypothetical protein
LRGFPGVRPLDPTRDLIGDYTVDDLREAGYWPPWLRRDLNRDGREDIAAAVVRPSISGVEFAVVALHGGEGNTAHWVVPFQAQRIYGVAGSRGTDAVNVLFCVHCDWDFWLRWNGAAYEKGLYAVGEHVAVADRNRDVPAALFSSPNEGARQGATVPGCTEAIVRQVSGRAGERWYEVDIPALDRRAWIPERLTDVNPCSG